MSHEFLTSLHSHVIETRGESKVGKFTPKRLNEEGGEVLLASKAESVNDLHRTVGISMSPKLRERAVARAKEVGLSFSRYVQWCLEAELDGVPLSERFKL